ncbi:MAG TPA: hypothetical protein VGP91_16925, partial [Actinoplanes sp.]|nr:hypothetical protein [Actinoplanes sp.]
MTAVTYARLRATDPGKWRAAAVAWRTWAALAGRWSVEFGPVIARLSSAWSGAAATAAFARVLRLRRTLDLFRLLCWEADQTLSEFAAALERAKTLLARAAGTAARAGLVIGDDGVLTTATGAARSGYGAASHARDAGPAGGLGPAGSGPRAGSPQRTGGASQAASVRLTGGPARSGGASQAGGWGRGGGASQATVRAGHGTVRAAVEDATADLSAALRLAAEADAAAVRRLTEV